MPIDRQLLQANLSFTASLMGSSITLKWLLGKKAVWIKFIFFTNTKSRFAPVDHDSRVLVSPKSVPSLPNLTASMYLFSSTSNIPGIKLRALNGAVFAEKAKGHLLPPWSIYRDSSCEHTL